MNRPSRNSPCHCGSGKKYKRCHGRDQPVDPFHGLSDDILAVYRNRTTGRVILADRRMLWTHFSTEGPERAQAFDAALRSDIDEVSQEVAIVSATLTAGLEELKRDETQGTRKRCAGILMNALQSVIGAVDLVRLGYGLQPGIVLRSAIEGIVVVYDVSANEESFKRFEADRYSVDNVMSRTDSLFRVLKPVYGLLSNQHTHIGKAHEVPYEWNSVSSDARGSLQLIKMVAILLSVATEMLFNEVPDEPRYWRRLPSGELMFAPTSEMLTLIREFPELKSDPTQPSPVGAPDLVIRSSARTAPES